MTQFPHETTRPSVPSSRGSSVLPNLLLVGAMKAGSTSIAAELDAIPAVDVPHYKEPNFLSGSPSLADLERRYGALFRNSSAKYRADCSTYYTKYPEHPDAPALASRFLSSSELRIIYVVRHPLDRALSHYRHEFEVGKVQGTFEQAVANNSRFESYGDYYGQLARWERYFPKSSFLILSIERYSESPADVRSEIAAFLSCEASASLAPANLNVARSRLRHDSLLARAARTRLYREHLGPLVPAPLRSRIRDTVSAALSRSAPRPDTTVSPQLKRRFDDLAKLQALSLASEWGAEDLGWRLT